MTKRNERLQGRVGAFLKQYARKHARHDPNDRSYRRHVQELVKRMRPEEFHELMDPPEGDRPRPPTLPD